MFSLDLRAATLGRKSKTDAKEGKDGAEDETRLTFELEELKLEGVELNALLREPHAWQCLYNTGKSPIEPYLKGLKSLELASSIEGAYVRVDVGLSGYTRFDFKGCTLAKIKLELRQEGITAMSCRVSVAPDLNGKLATLLEFLGRSVKVELRGEAPGAQADLPLNTFGGTGVKREKVDTAERRGRKPASAPAH